MLKTSQDKLKKSQNIANQVMNQNGSVIVQCPLKNQRAWNIWWPARPITSKKSKRLHLSTHIPPQEATLLASAASLGCWRVSAGSFSSDCSETWQQARNTNPHGRKPLCDGFGICKMMQNVTKCKYCQII